MLYKRSSMEGGSSSLERRLRTLTDSFVQSEMRRYEETVARSKRSQLAALAAELHFSVLPTEEHEALLTRAEKSKVQSDAELKERLDRDVDKLQRELTHQLEIKKLQHEKEIVRLQERLRYLDPSSELLSAPCGEDAKEKP
jgi:hypothetical protein